MNSKPSPLITARRHAGFALALLALGLTGCKATADGGELRASAGSQDSKASDEDKARERADKAWELEQAKLDLRSTEMDIDLSMRAADAAVIEAEQGLEEAKVALAAFLETERGHQLGEAELGLERLRNRATESEMELEELEAMYADDEFAGKTKELVLERGRRSLALARRQLELQVMEVALLRETQLPQKEREHRHKLEKAERALGVARSKREQAELDAERKRRKAQHGIEKLERELAKASEAPEA